MSVSLRQGPYKNAFTRLLVVSEGTVRYQLKRMRGAVVEGRTKREPKAAIFSDEIEAWRS